MAQVSTGFEPTGGGWRLNEEKIYMKDPPGTQVYAEYVDVSVPAIAGHDLWGAISCDDFHQRMANMGRWVHYVSLWRDPANPIIGIDHYRAIAVYRAA